MKGMFSFIIIFLLQWFILISLMFSFIFKVIFCSGIEDENMAGYAYQRSVCTVNCGIVIRNNLIRVDVLSFLATHEIGHTLGMVHDEEYRKGISMLYLFYCYHQLSFNISNMTPFLLGALAYGITAFKEMGTTL